MSRRTLTLDEALHDYVIEHGVREHPELAALREATREHPRAGMQIVPEQGQLMALLVRLLGARRTIEIGVFTGYSALAVALALPDDGRMLACDISDEYTRVGRPYWKRARASTTRSNCVLEPAAKRSMPARRRRRAASYDFAFIDADKANYDAYYERCLKLLRAGGLIADRQRAVERRRGEAGRTATPTRAPCSSSTTSSTATPASTSRCCRSATA